MASPNTTLHSTNSTGMPLLGFGTYQMSEEQAVGSVYEAIKSGFRHIDSAEVYGNEVGTGIAIAKALQDNIVTRQELFITTKVFPGYTIQRH